MDEQTLIPLEEAYTTSPHVGELMEALARAQATMANPDEDRNNPFFNSRYPSMASVRNASVPVLAQEGIAVTQFGYPQLASRSVRCITTLWFKDQFLRGTMVMPVTKTPRRNEPLDPNAELTKQDYAGTITYARRTQLLCLIALAGEPDDDGNDGPTPGAGQARRESVKRPDPGNMLATTGGALDGEEVLKGRPLVEEVLARATHSILRWNHAGLYKEILLQAFAAHPGNIREQPPAVLQRGMTIFRHLCDELDAHGKPPFTAVLTPTSWVAEEIRKLTAGPQGDTVVAGAVHAENDEPPEAGATGPSWGPDSPDLMEEDEAEDKGDAAVQTTEA